MIREQQEYWNDSSQPKYEAGIRNRVSYKWFDELIKAYDFKNRGEFFEKLHEALDDRKFWGSQAMSDIAMESLNLAIQDNAITELEPKHTIEDESQVRQHFQQLKTHAEWMEEMKKYPHQDNHMD